MQRTQRNATKTLTGSQSDVISEAKYANQTRAVCVITSLVAVGGNTIYVSVGEEAAANKGIPLAPGQSFAWAMDSGYVPPKDQITAYSAGADSLAIYEEIIVQEAD
jgi:hypothetical protein